MMSGNFKKKKDSRRPEYLRYDDVFLSHDKYQSRTSSPSQRPPLRRENNDDRYAYNDREQRSSSGGFRAYRNYSDEYDNYEEDDGYYEETSPRFTSRNDENFENEDNFDGEENFREKDPYFSENRSGQRTGRNIIDERMIRFQKRQLPPLQRYPNQNRRDNVYNEYQESSYWSNNDDYHRRPPSRNGVLFRNMWQKFIITFAGLISLVCVSWIVYNWNSDSTPTKQENSSPLIIEPEQQSFKVLPDSSNQQGVPHQDKIIYDKVDKNTFSQGQEENAKLLPPQETPVVSNINQDIQRNTANFQEQNKYPLAEEEYSIIDDKVYYIKISSNKNKSVLQGEINSIRSKYSDKIMGKECSIKSVRDKSGEKKHAILIGPYESRNQAIDVARSLNSDCSVVAVKE